LRHGRTCGLAANNHVVMSSFSSRNREVVAGLVGEMGGSSRSVVITYLVNVWVEVHGACYVPRIG